MTKEKPSVHLSVSEKMIKGLKDLSVDDKVTFKLSGKITGVNRDDWYKGQPLSVSAKITSGEILDVKGKSLRERLSDASKKEGK